MDTETQFCNLLSVVLTLFFRQFASLEGWTTLEETVKELKDKPDMTKLVLDLRGIDPDDSFSSIPYEKGYAFLYYLETKVGGAGM